MGFENGDRFCAICFLADLDNMTDLAGLDIVYFFDAEECLKMTVLRYACIHFLTVLKGRI